MSRITDRVAGYVQDVIDRAAPDLDVEFDVTMAVVPSPQNGQPQPILFIVLTMPSALIDQGLTGSLMIQNLRVGAEQVEGGVRQVIEGLQAQRSSQLGQANGHKPNASGLILPGQ